MKSETVDVVVVGGGAAGMMCAIEAARRGRRVVVLDHGRAPGEKIRISGGGRCNFTNLGTTTAQFLGGNPRFAASALGRYRPQDFVALLDRAGIAWHEKTLGQLFCDGSAKQIVSLLTRAMSDGGVGLRLNTAVSSVSREGERFALDLADGTRLDAVSLVVATGGKSIPKMGATGWGYATARQFGLTVTETRPGLVPLTFEPGLLERTAPLAGVALEVSARSTRPGTPPFREGLLFTHRGLSGPAILQISSYWREGEAIEVRLAPDVDVHARLKAAKGEPGRRGVTGVLSDILPRRLAESLAEREGTTGRLAETGDAALRRLDQAINGWTVKPVGSEGYRTAEVTLGGVETSELDQKTMQARRVPGLYFVGEVVDVTGWLGGYNFQWAWASGWAAGQVC